MNKITAHVVSNLSRMAAIAAAALSVSVGVSVAQAHEGPRIFLGQSNGQVVTYLGNADAASTSFVSERVFGVDLPNFLSTGVYTTEFPGFQVAEGHGVSAGTTFGFSIAGPLMYFSGYDAASGSGTFESVSSAFAGNTVPQVAVSQSAQISITAGGPVGGFDYFTYNGAGDHGHLTYTLFGNGVSASDGAAGMYAVPLQVGGNGLAESETFYLLLGKEVDDDSPEFLAAMGAAQSELVPEPSGVGVVGIAATILLRRRR